MLTVNNPLVLFAGKLFGVGVELRLSHSDDSWLLCFEAEAVAWKYCKEWARAR